MKHPKKSVYTNISLYWRTYKSNQKKVIKSIHLTKSVPQNRSLFIFKIFLKKTMIQKLKNIDYEAFIIVKNC